MEAFEDEYSKAKTKDHFQRTNSRVFVCLMPTTFPCLIIFSRSILSFETAAGGDNNQDGETGGEPLATPGKDNSFH